MLFEAYYKGVYFLFHQSQQLPSQNAAVHTGEDASCNYILSDGYLDQYGDYFEASNTEYCPMSQYVAQSYLENAFSC